MELLPQPVFCSLSAIIWHTGLHLRKSDFSRQTDAARGRYQKEEVREPPDPPPLKFCGDFRKKLGALFYYMHTNKF